MSPKDALPNGALPSGVLPKGVLQRVHRRRVYRQRVHGTALQLPAAGSQGSAVSAALRSSA